MKKLFTIMTTALLATTVVAQQKHVISRANIKPLTIAAMPNETEASTQRLSSQSHATAPGNQLLGGGTVTGDEVLVLPNLFGYQNGTQRHISAVPALGAVAVANRQNVATYGSGTSGNYRYSISTNNGMSWEKGLGVINPYAANLGPARYPNTLLFTNGGSTAADLKMAVLGPTLNTSGAGWVGCVQVAVTDNLTTAPSGTVTQEDYVYPTIGGLILNSITERVPNEYWAIGEPADPAQNPDDYTYILKGSYNSATDKVDWVIDTLTAPWNKAVDGSAHHNDANIAFSPDGQSGYIVAVGDLVGGQDSVYSPVVWEYKPGGGGAWLGPWEIGMQFPEVEEYIQLWVDSVNAPLSNRGIATTGFSCTIAVDANGNPHIGLLVGPSSIDINGGTLTPYSISSGFGLRVMDVTKDSYGDWNMIVLHDQNGFREDFTAGTATSIDATPHVSRSADGNYMFFTWSDTDTLAQTSAGDNNAPDMWGRMYDVANDMITPDINWTVNDGAWKEKARLPKVAEYVLEKAGPAPCNKTFILPVTIIDLEDVTDAGQPCHLWYLNDVEYDCNEATLTPTWFYNCQENPMTISSSTVVPASCGQTNGGFTASVAGGIAPFTYEVINATTGTVVPNANGVVANVGAGSYSVHVTDSKGCMEMGTITVTNPNAPVATLVSSTPPTCGAANGTATISITGGTGNPTTIWTFNGSQIGTGTSISNLPNGTSYYTITDGAGCTTSGSVSLSGTPGVDAIGSVGNPVCAGDLGSITIVPSGGTPAYSIVWANGGLTGFAPTGVPAGTYSYTITDQSTPNACTFTGTATVVAPSAISGTLSTTPNSTYGPYNGTCNVVASGGTPPYSYSWSLVNSAGAAYTFPTNPTTSGFLTGLPGGTLTCVITDANGCEFTVASQVVEGPGTGINEALANLASMKAYPNPADAVVNLNVVLKQPDNVRIEIVDMNGRILNSQTFSRTNTISAQFDVRALASGVYYIKLNTSEGVVTQKLFIE